MTDDALIEAEQRSGCPVIDLDTSTDRPVGEWSRDLNRLREHAPILWNQRYRCWVITRAALVREVFQDPAVFTNDSISPGNPDPPYRWIPSNVNPPRHVQYRQILNHAFGPAPVARAEPHARRACAEAIDAVIERGGCDYVAEIGGVYATRVFLSLIDLPYEDAPLLCGWAERIFDGFFSGPDAMAAFAESRQYFVDLVADRRARPRDPDHDFTSHLLGSSVDGVLLDDEAVLNIFNQLMLAGLDTVKSAMSYAHLHLATHAADRRRVVEEPEVIPSAVEEVLRAFPLVMEGRKLSQDIVFHGAEMKCGEMVMLLLPAVMHDPEHFDRPDDVVIDRVRNNHLSFGGGPHRCLGSHLARMEMRVGLEEWHRRIPDYELACDVGDVIERGGQLSLRALPLRWPA
jgi:cytochrome P450